MDAAVVWRCAERKRCRRHCGSQMAREAATERRSQPPGEGPRGPVAEGADAIHGSTGRMMHKRGYQRRIAKLLRPALWLAAITSVSVLVPPKAVSAVDRPFLTGVNLAGAGFGSERIVKGGGRGRHGIDYVYPVEPFAPGY